MTISCPVVSQFVKFVCCRHHLLLLLGHTVHIDNHRTTSTRGAADSRTDLHDNLTEFEIYNPSIHQQHNNHRHPEDDDKATAATTKAQRHRAEQQEEQPAVLAKSVVAQLGFNQFRAVALSVRTCFSPASRGTRPHPNSSSFVSLWRTRTF